MNQLLSDHGIQTRNQTREMVRSRTCELASIAGRKPDQITQADYEQAKRELTGETDFDLQQQALDRAHFR
ncbi:MAG: hypothetical protein V4689_05225 [Verrucomicrobiota bacterium]